MHEADKSTSRLGAASNLPELSPADEKAVDEQSRPSAALIHETIRAEGEGELKRSAFSLLMSGGAAGLSMGFSLIAQGLVQTHLPATEWRRLVVAFGYTVGFAIVILGRQQLFTENTLTPVLSLLHRRTAHVLGATARLWALVLLSNLLATWAIAAVLALGPAFDAPVRAAFADISREAVAHPFGTTALKGVFAGWLIATMAWLLPAAGPARFAVTVFITYVVAIGGFAHVIAGSVDAAYLVFLGEIGMADYGWRFLAPTLLGNVVGGVSLVALLNYGQVADEI